MTYPGLSMWNGSSKIHYFMDFWHFFCWRLCTQGLIKTLGSMVIFDENQGVSDLSKYEFLCPIHVKIIKFLVI